MKWHKVNPQVIDCMKEEFQSEGALGVRFFHRERSRKLQCTPFRHERKDPIPTTGADGADGEVREDILRRRFTKST